MGSKLIEKVLTKRVPIKAVITWLEGRSKIDGSGEFECDIEDFVSCFIHFLRDQAARILNPEVHTSPVKETKTLLSIKSRNTETKEGQRSRDSQNESIKIFSSDDSVNKETARKQKPGRKKSTDSSALLINERNRIESKSCKESQGHQKRITPINVDRSNQMKGAVSGSVCAMNAREDVISQYEYAFREHSTKTLVQDNEHKTSVHSLPHAMCSFQNIGVEVTADPFLVSHISELHIMADIYCCLINFHYIPNLMTELCFIMCLLVVQPFPMQEIERSKNLDKLNYLDSIHNCVYFSSLMLNSQRHLLEHFDTITLKMLAENNSLKTFMPELCNFIGESLKHATKQNISTQCTVKCNENVSFLLENDNRMNFPTDQAFHGFCKQRDGLYEILRIWEANHQSVEWSFGAVLAPKIRVLLSQHSDPGNFVHFARLFRSLLLGRCSGVNEITEMNESYGSLGFSKVIDLEKLKRLHERFVTPHNSGVHSLFPGHQEFFCDFIIYSSNPAFFQHLSDSFNSEILVLNESNFVASDLEEIFVDDLTKRNYVRSLSALRLLGKFAGFIAFLPYHSQANVLSENIIAAQASVRDKIKPSLDVLKCLTDAAEKRRLILTLPWVLEYLSQMDTISLHLNYFRSVFEMLIKIYHQIQFLNCGSEDRIWKLPGKAFLLIRLLLGWFFDSPNFPDLFSTLSLKHRSSLSKSDKQSSASPSRDPQLDELDIVDDYCLYLCCPFIAQLKLCLLKDPGNLYNDSWNSEKRKTHLVSFHWSPKPSPTDEIQMDLEEMFLHNQPISTRRSIEYVAERVASCCVKYICTEVTFWVKRNATSRVEAELEAVNIKKNEYSYNALKAIMANKFNELASIACKEFKKSCDTELESFCYSRCKNALPPLMANNEKVDIVDACVSISARLSWEKVGFWIDAHLSESNLTKDFKSEMCKTLRHHSTGYKIKQNTNVPKRNLHDDSIDSVPQVLKKIKVLIRECLNNDESAKQSASSIFCIVDAVKATLEKRQDVTPSAERVIMNLTVDLLLVLVINHPECVQLDNVRKFVSLWNNIVPANLSRLLCSRNVMLLCQSRHPSKTVWAGVSQLISILLTMGMLSPSAVEQQCISLLQSSWPQNVLTLISGCCKDIVQNYSKNHPYEMNKFSLMMSWLSESFEDMECFRDDYN